MRIRPVANSVLVSVALVAAFLVLGRWLYIFQIDRSYSTDTEYWGRVTDVQNKGIPGVELLLIDGLGRCRVAQTEFDGGFRFPQITDWKYIGAFKNGMEFMYVDRYSPKKIAEGHRFIGWDRSQFSSAQLHEVGKIYPVKDAGQILLGDAYGMRFSGIRKGTVEIAIDGAQVAFVENDKAPMDVPDVFYEKLVIDIEKFELINSVFFRKGDVIGWVRFGIRKKGGVLLIEWGESQIPVEHILYPAHAYNDLYNEVLLEGARAFDRYHKVPETDCASNYQGNYGPHIGSEALALTSVRRIMRPIRRLGKP